jgi:hypothetical protein
LAAVAIGAGLFAEKGLDILGDKGSKIPEEQAQSTALAQYQDTFSQASPAGKFALQYLQTTEVKTPKYEGNWGILSLFASDNYFISIDNGCLKKTAYDIAGGSMEGSFDGLFSSGKVKGDVPTAAAYAYVDSKSPDRMVVESGHDQSLALHFSGAEDSERLQPADEQTQNVLATYGCEESMIGTRDAIHGDSSSNYLR